MATYEKVGTIGTIKQIEVPLYGSDRVGMAKRSAERGTLTATDTVCFREILLSVG